MSADDVSSNNAPARFVPAQRIGAGLGFAVAAYGAWGILPLYFNRLAPAGAFEIVSWRIALSLVFCAILLTVTRGWHALFVILHSRRTVLIMGVAGVAILINWVTFILATLAGHVVEASLGYFTNPILTMLLGVFVLKERLRPLQWIAVGISIAAVLVLALNYGQFPWIALILAFTFAAYGLIKKQVGPTVDAVSGLTLESAWLTPIAVIVLVVLGATGQLVIGTVSPAHTALLLSAGVLTAVPLIFFASAARRLPLTIMGTTQYLAPILQFVIGITVLHEQMPAARWAGFVLVWIALIVLTVDLFRAGRSARSLRPETV